MEILEGDTLRGMCQGLRLNNVHFLSYLIGREYVMEIDSFLCILNQLGGEDRSLRMRVYWARYQHMVLEWKSKEELS